MNEKRGNNNFYVGQEIAFKFGYREENIVIKKIDRITPTGRLVCGSMTLNPDLSIRGEYSYNGPYRGEIVTGEIREKYEKQKLVRQLKLLKFESLDLITLMKINKILKESEVKEIENNK